MIEVNAIGKSCPMPLVMTKKQIEEVGAGEYKVFVDNEIAKENILKFCKSNGYEANAKNEDENIVIDIVVKKVACKVEQGCDNLVVSIGTNVMGKGDDELGARLLKGFIFAVLQLENLPKTMLFYNGGAFLTCEGSESLEDLQKLEGAGVEIKTCGTCLDNYSLKNKLKVGTVTNMYDIVEIQANASRIIRP